MRIYSILSILFFPCLIVGCQSIRRVGETEFTDEQRKQHFNLTPAKLEILRRAANDRLPVEYRDNPKLLSRYDFWPVIVDRHFRGLWHFDNYSHEGPILVINGKNTATVIPLLSEKAPTIDSLNAVFHKYPTTEINSAVRAEILRNIKSIHYLH